MKANFPNQRARKTRNTTVAMTTPTIPRKPVTDTSVLGGLKCEGKAVCKGGNIAVKSNVRIYIYMCVCVGSKLGLSWRFFQKFLTSSKDMYINQHDAQNSCD